MLDKLDREWIDISSEEYRAYFFPNADKAVVIDYPNYLHISDSGGHRIISKDGISFYIPPTWIAIEWKGEPNFVL